MIGTLHQLKTWLLNPDLVAKTNYDDAIAQLGRGVAAHFEEHCNRKFARATRERVLSGHVCNLVLPAYPVEGVPVIETSAVAAPEAWEPAQTDLVKFHPASGVVWLTPTDTALRRITWKGGYWIPEAPSPGDPSSGLCPPGATPLPESLLFAWLQQCAHIWAKRQKLGIPPAATVSTAEVVQSLLPDVAAILATHRRYNL
jgi:hypothetical protein